MDIDINKLDVVVLCGGLGTRLQPIINDRPKPMAEIGRQPFLDYLLEYSFKFGFRRFVLCLGHMASVIKEYYSKKENFWDISYSEEKERLGTAGALKNAQGLIKSNPFLVMNGDSICPLDLGQFLEFHFHKGGRFSIVLSQLKENKDSGLVGLNGNNQVISFNEKSQNGNSCLANAGVYLFSQKIFEKIPSGLNYSLEYDVFPEIIKEGLFGFVTDQQFIDIGTPERYQRAQIEMAFFQPVIVYKS